MSMRPRDLGVPFDGIPGPRNSISDVIGVRVGHTTLISGDHSDSTTPVVRTGVTVVLPSNQAPWERPLFASSFVLNGNGEMTGLPWVTESGLLTSYIGLTNTASVGVVRDALVAYEAASRPPSEQFWSLPVVAETYDGFLNDIVGMHVRTEHVFSALKAASVEVAEGSVGGGTGMVSHGFKAGIGTSSRVISQLNDAYTVGVMVQANHGSRRRFQVLGRPIGSIITSDVVPLPTGPVSQAPEGSGSIIAIVATDAPLLPHQLTGLAKRVSLGIGRTGGLGEYSSGDIFLAFSTANPGLGRVDISAGAPSIRTVLMMDQSALSPIYEAVVDATEEAIVNAIFASSTMVGNGGRTAFGIPKERVLAALLDC